jgi:hypothetical protein
MILFLRQPKSDSWNFSWDRRKAQSNFDPRLNRKPSEQTSKLTKLRSESFLELRSLM